MQPKDADLAAQAVQIWRAGVDAVHPSNLVPRAVRVDDEHVRFEGRGPLKKFKVPLKSVRRIAVVGAGKAGAAMAAALEDALGDDVLASKDVRGLVNVPDATVVRLKRIELNPARGTHVNRATEAAVAGARRIRELTSKLGRDDVLIVLVSGGASALLPAPVEGVTLEEKERLIALLQSRGANVARVNCVRRHLSDVKGGRLASGTNAGLVVCLAISDVIGDPMHVIGSGPTAPDPTTHADALRVLEEYGVTESDPDAPKAAIHVLREGAEGRVPDTMKMVPDRVKNLVIGGNDDAVRRARMHAEVLGWTVLASRRPIGGDTSELARTVASFVRGASERNMRKGTAGLCLVSGGETTVKLCAQPGLGGRNQELALGVLKELGADGLSGACVLSGGTDGEDGPTDAAGAWADEPVARAASELGLDPSDYLARNDSYRFFERAGGLLKTGLTGTNVMDLRVALVDLRRRR